MNSNQTYAVIGGAVLLVLAIFVIGFSGDDDESAGSSEPVAVAESDATSDEAPAEETAEAAPGEETAEAAPAEEMAEATPAEETTEETAQETTQTGEAAEEPSDAQASGTSDTEQTAQGADEGSEQTAATGGSGEAAEQAHGGMFAQADPAAGEKVFRKCKACHAFDKNMVGPELNGVIGREIASVQGFNYSSALKDKGGKWTPEGLAAFLKDPKGWAPGTKMSFAGLQKEQQQADVIAYINQQSDSQVALGGAAAAAAGGAATAAAMESDDQQAESEGDQQAQAEGDQQAQAEGDQQAQAEGDQQAQAEGDQQAQAETDQQAQTEGDQQAQTEGDQQAQTEGDQQAEAEGDQQAEGEGDQQAEAETDQQAEAEGDQQAEAEGDQQAQTGATLGTGQAAHFAEGTVRLFVSQVDAEGERARVAVNGTDRLWLERGKAQHIEGTGCEVLLDAIDGRKAVIALACGLAESSTETPTLVAGTGGVATGQTAVLADDTIRAFVSQVDAEGERARVAVNGMARQWLETGKAVEIEGTGCSLSLDGFDNRLAMLSADCSGDQAGDRGQETAADSGDGAAGDGIAPGETVALAGGQVRVFLARVDREGKRARVAVNGFDSEWLDAGKRTEVGDTGCNVTLDGIDGRRAMLSAACADGVTTAGAAEEAVLTAGQAALFANETVRVFLSRADGGNDAARVTVNGGAPTVLVKGEPSEVEGTGCELELTAIDGRKATIAARCGAPEEQGSGSEDRASGSGSESGEQTATAGSQQGSDGAAQQTAAAGSQQGSEAGGQEGGDAASTEAGAQATEAESDGAPAFGIGETLIAADGDLRVFVGRIDGEANRARLAINGQPGAWVDEGSTLEIENGCKVTVDRIEGRRAMLSGSCG